MSDQDINDKQRVALYAADRVKTGMVVGLGTGSTANYFIEALARKKREEDLKIIVVASSVVSTRIAAQQGLELVAMEHLTKLDLYVDGADEVSPQMALLKGRGSDLVREKLLAKASDEFYVLVDDSKLVGRIGENYPIPIEVVPFSWQLVLRSLQQIGGEGELRTNGDGLAMSSHGSLILDMTFDASINSEELDNRLNAIPGIVEHGIFEQLATAILIGENGQVTQRLK